MERLSSKSISVALDDVEPRGEQHGDLGAERALLASGERPEPQQFRADRRASRGGILDSFLGLGFHDVRRGGEDELVDAGD